MDRKAFERLNREELIELSHILCSRFSWWRNDNQFHKIINEARARVLLRRAEEHWRRYESIQRPTYPSTSDPEFFEKKEACCAAIKAREGEFNKYLKLWEKADEIEFGKKATKQGE